MNNVWTWDSPQGKADFTSAYKEELRILSAQYLKGPLKLRSEDEQFNRNVSVTTYENCIADFYIGKGC